MLVECSWAKTVTYGHRHFLSLPLSLGYAHICTQLLVSSTDEFWENKQLQEEERTIRLDGLPNFIIYYGLPEMHTLLQPGARIHMQTQNLRAPASHPRAHCGRTRGISYPLKKLHQKLDAGGQGESSARTHTLKLIALHNFPLFILIYLIKLLFSLSSVGAEKLFMAFLNSATRSHYIQKRLHDNTGLLCYNLF